MLRTIATAVGLTLLQGSGAFAETNFVVISAKINPVKQPKAPADVFGDCARNAVCANLAKGAATYLGVPSAATTAAIAILSGDKPDDSEEGHFGVTLPKGYMYCRSKIHMISVVPADGKRASIFSASSTDTGLSIYTWTPKRGVGQGRSWVDADVTVYGVRNEKVKEEQTVNRCKMPGKNLINCRGNGGGDRPGCNSVED
jgi:hypothetical protein